MASTSESGHAKNVAYYDELIMIVNGFGVTYNPSKASLKLQAMQTLSAAGRNAIGAVNASLPAYNIAVGAREKAFGSLAKLTTRVINALMASDTPDQLVDSLRTIVRKIQGKRATPKKSDEEKKALEAEGKAVKEVSSSQMSYDSRLDNLDKMIKLLAGIPTYTPNEADLKVAGLTILYNDLKAKNTAVVSASVLLKNARIARNDVLYKANSGLVPVALDCKTYIKSLFGTGSPQYKQVGPLDFKNVKD